MPEGQRGQASIEWLALVLLLALAMGALLAAGIRVPGTALAETIAERMLCGLGRGACGEPRDLIAEYGPEGAAALRRHAPGLAYERGMETLPVDFRECRSRDCALHEGSGRVGGEEVSGPVAVAFTRLLDCRPGADRADVECPTGADRDGYDGSLYLQYWFYYPDSSTFKGVPLLEERGFHPHDWESYQVRIGADGSIAARASSHHGHNHSGGPASWASDIGIDALNDLAERTGIRPRGGWGEPSGWVFVNDGSHAGNVRGNVLRVASYTDPDDLRLIPLETIADDIRLPDFTPIKPPWSKRLWREPEAAGTS